GRHTAEVACGRRCRQAVAAALLEHRVIGAARELIGDALVAAAGLFVTADAARLECEPVGGRVTEPRDLTVATEERAGFTGTHLATRTQPEVATELACRAVRVGRAHDL